MIIFRYFAKEVNSKVDEVSICHSCGCCENAVLYARPYTSFKGYPIFSDPPTFAVGEGTTSGPDISYDSWKKKLRENNISECILEKIVEHFKGEADDWDEDYFDNGDLF